VERFTVTWQTGIADFIKLPHTMIRSVHKVVMGAEADDFVLG
jgi:hypothetical protein